MSKIQWTEQTWNPIVGCSIVSPGCTNCYAMKMAARIETMGTAPHYIGTTKKVNGNAVWTGKLARAPTKAFLAPLRRGTPTMYFVNSMSDLFHEDCPEEWIADVFNIMAATPHHTYQVLTKRADRMQHIMAGPKPHHLWSPNLWHCRTLPNVWLGVSTERQKEADERIPLLLQTPAAVRFISAEPLLGPIDLTDHCNGHYFFDTLRGTRWHDDPDGQNLTEKFSPSLDWVIVGGESGPGARRMEVDWALSLINQCKSADVRCFMKQIGSRLATDCDSKDRKGGNWNDWPSDMRVREMPNHPMT